MTPAVAASFTSRSLFQNWFKVVFEIRNTHRREKIISALLASNTRKEAAARAGVTERTIYSYLKDESFRKEYERARRGLVKQAAEQIQKSMGLSVETLRGLLDDKTAGSTARVQAARTLLEYGIKLTELTDIEERIAALERAAGGTDEE